MSLLKEYNHWTHMMACYYWDERKECRDSYYGEPEDLAKHLLFAVAGDILNRKGLDEVFSGWDPDVKEKILTTNLEIIRRHLPKK